MPITEPPRYTYFTARIMEITSTQAPWHRRLWRSGTMQVVRELLEESVQPGAPEAAIADQRKYVQHCLHTDHGIADHGRSSEGAVKAIKPGIVESSHDWIRLREHTDRMHQSYLMNWADSFDSSTGTIGQFDLEGAARRITAHLLDAGMHKSSLYAWLRAIRDDSTSLTIGEFLREADSRLKQPERTYTFCVPVEKIGKFDLASASGWMTAQETAQWRQSHARKAPGVPQRGSFLIEVQARDVNAAADKARSRLSNLAAKFTLGSKTPIVISPSMWSKEKGSEFPTQATNRVINVRSFERLGRVQDLEMPDYITNTLALVQPLRTAAPHIAVMSGWSAIESLMVGPSDSQDIIAARRFSLIVAASMVRAELSWLSQTYVDTHDDAIAEEMRNCEKNIDRARLFQTYVLAAPEIDLYKPVDKLALERIRPALLDPRQEVEKISGILTREFTRLYRKRNMIVHSGHTQKSNLHSISETLAPLIGAGIDRVVHVGLSYGVPPIELSAVAESRVNYLEPATPSSSGNLLDLLEF